MSTFALVCILMLPGMSKPDVSKVPVPSLEVCAAQAAEMHEKLKVRAGEDFIYAIACEVTSTKSDPA
jgi:hypothetical protein